MVVVLVWVCCGGVWSSAPRAGSISNLSPGAPLTTAPPLPPCPPTDKGDATPNDTNKEQRRRPCPPVLLLPFLLSLTSVGPQPHLPHHGVEADQVGHVHVGLVRQAVVGRVQVDARDLAAGGFEVLRRAVAVGRLAAARGADHELAERHGLFFARWLPVRPSRRIYDVVLVVFFKVVECLKGEEPQERRELRQLFRCRSRSFFSASLSCV